MDLSDSYIDSKGELIEAPNMDMAVVMLFKIMKYLIYIVFACLIIF